MARDKDVVRAVVPLSGGYYNSGGGDGKGCGDHDVDAKWKKLKAGILKELESGIDSGRMGMGVYTKAGAIQTFETLFSALKPLFLVRGKSIGGEDVRDFLDGWKSVLCSRRGIYVGNWFSILCVRLIAFCLERRDNDGAHLGDSAKKVLEEVLKTRMSRHYGLGDVWDNMAYGIFLICWHGISGPNGNFSSMSRKTHFLEDFLSVAFSSSFVEDKYPKSTDTAFFWDMTYPEEKLWGNDSESYERKADWIREYQGVVAHTSNWRRHFLSEFVFEIIEDDRFHPKWEGFSWKIEDGKVVGKRVDPVSKKAKTLSLQKIGQMLRDHAEELRKQEEETRTRKLREGQERQRKIREEQERQKKIREGEGRKIREEEGRKIREEEGRKLREEEERLDKIREGLPGRREMKEWQQKIDSHLGSLPVIASSLTTLPTLVSTISDLLKDQIAMKESQIADKAALVDLLQKEVEGLRSEMEFLRASDEVRAASVSSQIQSQRDELQSQREKIDAQQNEIAAQKDKIESLLAQIAAVQEQKAAASVVTSLEAESKSLREQIESLQTARIEFDGTNHEFKTTTMATTNDITTIVPTVESLQIESAPGHGSLDHDIAYDFEAEKERSASSSSRTLAATAQNLPEVQISPLCDAQFNSAENLADPVSIGTPSVTQTAPGRLQHSACARSNSSESIAAIDKKSAGVSKENRTKRDQSGINHEISTLQRDISTRVDQSTLSGAARLPTDAERLAASGGLSKRRMKMAMRPQRKERKTGFEQKRAEGFFRGPRGETGAQIVEEDEMDGQIVEEDEVDGQIVEKDEVDDWNVPDP